ncbi:hypothetical protein Q4555_05150 [Octadecabacter sp. 1_MG-2023]|uniref:hypothetical protein n=2 Tax=unclassified Octadecabacter TaxID=196158 RepID=UPI001C086486|nr:hypothetical protein [Octadecabacter sp. B2R22]MDO6734043.1 hypothetical protein [Octadecabacter sp. 1_MG-2023]
MAREPRGTAPLSYRLANVIVLTALTAGPIVWLTHDPARFAGVGLMFVFLLLIWMVGALLWSWRIAVPDVGPKPHKITPHFLLKNDKQGFMERLRLDTKTAVFDGSNIFHFGLDNDVSVLPLRMVARQLRFEGYRIVCFFDNNIFYRLEENGLFAQGHVHSLHVIMDLFGLDRDEIYIVPSGVQADGYVLSCLKHLPTSFAVTNDLFRDYARRYPSVMKGDLWRKGVYIQGNEVKLRQFKFEKPVQLTGVAVP